MRSIAYIGSVPAEESCAQVGDEDYRRVARIECRAYINLLRRVHGEEPEGAELRLVWCPHDFGSYAEVQCWYDDDSPAARAYAGEVENGLQEWDDAARREIGRELAKRGAS